MEYYSLKMRASQQVSEGEKVHENHISGAERIVNRERVEAVCAAMVRRALTHSKGDPDKINIKIEKFSENELLVLKSLPVTRIDVENWQQGLEKSFELIRKSVDGNNAIADFAKHLPELLRETFPMRGAMLYDIATGTRLEPDHERGVRATYMDALHSSEVDGGKNHFNEAIVLATNVTGYVASKELGYVRIMKMKEMGDENGGRMFLFDSRKSSAEECIDYLQKKKVLVEI